MERASALQKTYTSLIEPMPADGDSRRDASHQSSQVHQCVLLMAAACVADLGFLAPISRAVAGDTRIDPDDVMFGPETDRLLRLLRSTSREQCVPAFAREVKAGIGRLGRPI
jgi:hypothetical protein